LCAIWQNGILDKLLTLIVTIRKVVSAKRGGKRSPSMPERSKCRGGHFAMVT
jgi:hypothetical protein